MVPVNKAPPVHWPQYVLTAIDMFFVPVQHTTYGSKILLYKSIILTMHPVIIYHRYPVQRKRRDHLQTVTGIAALRKAFRYTGTVKVVNGLTHQAVVPGNIQ